MTERPMCPRCGGAQVRRYGTRKGYQRWRCRACRRIWNGAYWKRETYAANPNWAILTPTDNVRLTQAVKHRRGRRYDRRTPAMVIGLTDHVWTWKELLLLRGRKP